MVDYWPKKENEEDDIVDTLIRIPVKSLEERVKLLENEIRTRKTLSGDAICRLGTQQLYLEAGMRQFQYSTALGSSFNKNLKFQFINLEMQKIKEKIDCFRDVSKLEEKLLYVKEDLEMERQKFKLIK
jgi:hypothetical protein